MMDSQGEKKWTSCWICKFSGAKVYSEKVRRGERKALMDNYSDGADPVSSFTRRRLLDLNTSVSVTGVRKEGLTEKRGSGEGSCHLAGASDTHISGVKFEPVSDDDPWCVRTKIPISKWNDFKLDYSGAGRK